MKTLTGIKSLDSLTGGIPDDKVTTIVGRPGSGRSMTLLTLAVASEEDCAMFMPRLSYSMIRDNVSIIAANRGIEFNDIRWYTSGGMWLVIELPTHTIRVAGESTEVVMNTKHMVAAMTTLVDSLAAKAVYIDAPYLIAKTKDEEKALMSTISKYSRKTNVTIVVATRLRGDSEKSKNPEIDKAVKKASGLIMLAPSWPRVDGTNLKIDLKIIKDLENPENEDSSGSITLDRTSSSILLN